MGSLTHLPFRPTSHGFTEMRFLAPFLRSGQVSIFPFPRFLFQNLPSVGADRRANAAVVPLVIPEIVFLFPVVAGPDIQDLFPRQSRNPCVAFQCLCGAGFYAARTTTAEASLHRGTTREFHVGEDGSQSNPWTERARDQLTMETDPAQPRSRGCRFVGEISFDRDRIGSIRGGQRSGTKPSGFDFGCQRCGDIMDMTVHSGIFVCVCLVGSVPDAGHDAGVHRDRQGKSERKPSSGFVRGCGEPPKISRTPEINRVRFHPPDEPDGETGGWIREEVLHHFAQVNRVSLGQQRIVSALPRL